VFSVVLCSVRDDELAKQSANSSGRMSQICSLDGADYSHGRTVCEAQTVLIIRRL